ncbi:MAG: DUF2142 domain-containing protein [Elusimicrobiales bacterium]
MDTLDSLLIAMDGAVRKAPAKVFFAGFVLCGLFFIALMPPYQTPDEPAHLLRACRMLQGEILPAAGAPHGAFVPEVKAVSYLPWQMNARFSLEKLREIIKTSPPLDARAAALPSADPKDEAEKFFTPTLYSPAAYAPVIAALVAAKLFSLLSAAAVFAAGFAVVSRAFTARERLLYAVAAFLPMNIHQSAACSADGVTLSLSFLATALGLAMFASDEEGKPHALFLCVSALLGLCKYVYIVIPFALETAWLLKAPAKRIARAAGFAAAVIVPAALWAAVVNGYMPHVGVPAEQAGRLLHPLAAFAAALKTCFRCSYMQGLIANFGWYDAPAPRFNIQLYFCAMLITASAYSARAALPHLAGWAAIICLYCAIMLLQIIAPFIGGDAQGRYFLPMMPLLLLSVPRFIKLSERGMRLLCAFTAAHWLYFFLYACLYSAVWSRYWSAPLQ